MSHLSTKVNKLDFLHTHQDHIEIRHHYIAYHHARINFWQLVMIFGTSSRLRTKSLKWCRTIEESSSINDYSIRVEFVEFLSIYHFL